ncbi:MAG: type II toxin-antitoxin system VapC family toxin, partial [bacterium]
MFLHLSYFIGLIRVHCQIGAIGEPVLLDTNAWINYLKDPDSRIRSKLASFSPQEIVTCSIVISELLHGAEKYGNRIQRVSLVKMLLDPFTCFPFDDVDASYYAAIRHDL